MLALEVDIKPIFSICKVMQLDGFAFFQSPKCETGRTLTFGLPRVLP